MRYKINDRRVVFSDLNENYFFFRAGVKQCVCGKEFVTRDWKKGMETVYGDGIRFELGRRSIDVSPIKRGCNGCAERMISEDSLLRKVSRK